MLGSAMTVLHAFIQSLEGFGCASGRRCRLLHSSQPPGYQSVDVVYGLGSSVGVASGFKNKEWH